MGTEIPDTTSNGISTQESYIRFHVDVFVVNAFGDSDDEIFCNTGFLALVDCPLNCCESGPPDQTTGTVIPINLIHVKNNRRPGLGIMDLWIAIQVEIKAVCIPFSFCCNKVCLCFHQSLADRKLVMNETIVNLVTQFGNRSFTNGFSPAGIVVRHPGCSHCSNSAIS